MVGVHFVNTFEADWIFNTPVTAVPDPDGFFVSHIPGPGVTDATIQPDPHVVRVTYDLTIAAGDAYDLSNSAAEYSPGHTFPHAAGFIT